MASKVPDCDDVEPIRVECVEEIVRETTHEGSEELLASRDVKLEDPRH